jgi:hypothetical protein
MGGCRRRMFAGLGAVAVVWGALAPVSASVAASPVVLKVALPGSGTAGTTIALLGRASRGSGGSTAELERTGAAGRWTVLAKGTVSGGRFRLLWKPRTSSFLTIRVIAVRRGKTIAHTKPASILIGAAPVYCAAPSPPGQLPPGDGYVVGGVYDVGGPAPGITVCVGRANTVTLTASSGAVAASQQVGPGDSYTFVVPAGTYTLAAGPGYCRGSATVRAGAETKADTVCDVP